MFYSIVAYTGFALLCGIALFYGCNFKQLGYRLRVVFFFLLILTLIEAINKYLWIQKENNLFTAHLYGYLEFFVLLPFYFKSQTKQLKRYLFLPLCLLVMGMLVYGSVRYSFFEYNVTGLFAVKLFIIIMSLRELYLYYFSETKHYYYVNLSLLLSGLMGLTLFSFGNVLSHLTSEVQRILWTTNGVVFIIGLVLIGMELYLEKYGK